MHPTPVTRNGDRQEAILQVVPRQFGDHQISRDWVIITLPDGDTLEFWALDLDIARAQ